MQQHLIGRSRLAWVQLVHSRLTPAKKVLDTWNIAPPRTIISININTLTPAKKVLDNSNITLLAPFVITCISQQLKLNSRFYLKITWKTTSSNHQSHFHPNILAPTVVVLALLPPSNHQILVYLLIS